MQTHITHAHEGAVVQPSLVEISGHPSAYTAREHLRALEFAADSELAHEKAKPSESNGPQLICSRTIGLRRLSLLAMSPSEDGRF